MTGPDPVTKAIDPPRILQEGLQPRPVTSTGPGKQSRLKALLRRARDQVMRSTPPMYARKASGTVIEPSASW